jgi:hypothetical protein
VARRLCEVAGPPTLSFKDTMMVVVSTVSRRVDRALVSFGVGRWRVSIQVQRILGCVPGRCIFSVASIYCGSIQSLRAKGIPLIWDGHGASFNGGGWRLFDDGGWRWSAPASSGSTGTRVFIVIFIFVRGLCASRLEQLSMLYPLHSYLYLYENVYVFLI